MNTRTSPINNFILIASCSITQFSTDSAENNGGSPWQHEMLLLSIISAHLKITTVSITSLFSRVSVRSCQLLLFCVSTCAEADGSPGVAEERRPARGIILQRGRHRPPSAATAAPGRTQGCWCRLNGSAVAESCFSRDARGSSSGRARARFTHGRRHRVLLEEYLRVLEYMIICLFRGLVSDILMEINSIIIQEIII